MKTISLKEYEKLPILYNEDGSFRRNMKLKPGDYFLIKEPEDFKEVGDCVTVYKVIRLTDVGEESSIEILKIE